MRPTSYYMPEGRSSYGSTAFMLDGVGTVSLVFMLGFAILWRAIHRRHARAAAESEKGGMAPLLPGPTVLAGKVVDDGDPSPAVAVEIEQEGSEYKHKGRWYHHWTERSRQVTARPFYVVRPDGAQVRVEPDGDAFLVDKLDGVTRLAPLRRRRTATLVTDELVHIVGTLVRAPDPMQGGYREAGTGWVLRPPRGGRMLISTEALADRAHRRARVHRNLAIALLVALLGLHCVVFFSFNLMRFHGREVEATVTSTNSYRRWHKPRNGQGYWVYYYRVRASFTDDNGVSHPLSDHTSRRFYDDTRVGSTVPFVVVKGHPGVHQIGLQPTGDDLALIVLFATVIGFAVAYPRTVIRTRPWYERRKVVDTGGGKLTG